MPESESESESESANGDDPSIAGDEVVLRRVKAKPSMVVTDSLTGAVRPSSGAFKPDDDGISVYREQLLLDVGFPC